MLNISKFLKKGKGGNFARNRGKISSRGRGGGLFKKFRIIDKYRALWNIPSFIISFDYNSKHQSSLVILSYFIGIISYIPSIAGLKIGKILMSSKFIKLKKGNSTFIKFIPRGLKISLVETVIGAGCKLILAPGSVGTISKRTKFYSFIKLPSKAIKKISNFCYCTVGRVSILKYRFIRKFRAGGNRLLGFRPIVRGVAMNPIDHPHGGGVGKKSKKSSKMSPWGKIIIKKK